MLIMLLFSIPVYSSSLTAAIGDYPPYTSADNTKARLAEELVIASYQSVGYEVKIRRVPWKRAYEEVKSGKIDITFPWIKTVEREKFFLFSNKLLMTQEVFLHHKDANFTWSTLDDLNAYSIGATQGYAHVQLMQGADVGIDIALDDTTNLTKLLKHRIDAFPIGKKVASYLINKSPSELKENILVHPKPLFTNDNFVLSGNVFPIRSKLLLDKFNQGLDNIKLNGQFDKIIAKYEYTTSEPPRK